MSGKDRIDLVLFDIPITRRNIGSNWLLSAWRSESPGGQRPSAR
jgi:hypothetical protein